MIHGVLDPLVQRGAQLLNSLQAGGFALWRRVTDVSEVEDGRPDAHSCQITDLLALFVHPERAKFHVFSLENGLIFRIQNYCGWNPDEDLAPHAVHARDSVVRGGRGVDDGARERRHSIIGPAYCLIDRFNVFSTLATFETRRPEWPFR